MASSKNNKILRGCFVTGTDTGVGKTYVSTRLMRYWVQQGLRVAPFKPIASGAENGVQEDVEALQAQSNVGLANNVVNPYCFEPPIAPYIAAKEVGVEMSLDSLVSVYEEKIKPACDVCVIEGAGGFLQPLNDTETLADLARECGLPVVMVVSIKLGCINHSLLTQSSVLQQGCEIKGWYANLIEPDQLRVEEQIQLIERYVQAPLLGIIGQSGDVKGWM